MTVCKQETIGQATQDSPHYDVAQIGLWYGCNYGGMLTAYALHRKISQLGYSCILLNHSPLTPNPVYHDEDNPGYCFMRRHSIPYSSPLRSDADFIALNDMADTFVIGSDQVWRWDFSKEKGYVYFLDFVKGDKRKIAYSASFGVEKENRPEANLRKARLYMQRFDAVSVREKSGVDILRDAYHVQGEWMPDPVFLQTKEFYEQLAKPCSLPGSPYLFAYILDPTPAKQALLKQLAEAKGLVPVIIHDGYAAFKNGEAGIPTPEEWLYMMAHSAFVFTDSFHGVCFAHILNKDFTAVSPAQRGHARFMSILSCSGLTERLISETPSSDALLKASMKVDWEPVNAILRGERERGENWLRNALQRERSPYCEYMGNMTYELLYDGKGELDREWETELRLEQQAKRFLARWLSPLLIAKSHAWGLAASIAFGRLKHSFKRRALLAKAEHHHLRRHLCR